MLSIDTSAAIARLKLLRSIQEHKVENSYKHLVDTIFKDLLEHTPQWSGNLVANWKVEVGSAWQGSSGYTHYGEVFQSRGKSGYANAYQAGDAPGIMEAYSNAEEAISRIRWNSIVRIVNHVPYADEVEAGKGPAGKEIRPVNKFPYGNVHGIAMVGYIQLKYGRLGFL